MKTLKPQEVFEYLDLEFNFIAMNEEGDWWAYDKKPSNIFRNTDTGYWHPSESLVLKVLKIPVKVFLLQLKESQFLWILRF